MSNYLGHCEHCEYALFAEEADIATTDTWRDIIAGHAPKRMANYGVFGRCNNNHKVFRLQPVKGKFSEKHTCDARCMHAKGTECTCSCGGANHGRGHAVEIHKPTIEDTSTTYTDTSGATEVKMATEKQVAFITTLLDEREMAPESLQEALRRLAVGITKVQAHAWIDRLKTLEKKEALSGASN